MSPPPVTVVEVLRRRREQGDKPLLICDDARLSYRAADTWSAALACRLVALGAGKGTHIGVLFPNGPQFVVAMLAAARIGAVVVPFSTFSTAAELGRQLVDSDVAVLLASRGYRDHDYVARLSELVGPLPKGPAFSAAAPVLRHIVFDVDDGHAIDDHLLTALEDDVDGSDVLSIVYTSGSTGAPKGVVHTHEALVAHQRNLNRIRGLTDADKLFCNSPFFWIGGFAFGLLATLVAGATLVCSDADAGRTLDLLENEKPTVTNGFVAGVAHLTRHPSFAERDLSSMRRGNLYPIMAPDVRPRDSELRHNMLGMTEAGSVLLLSDDETDQPESRRGSYGFLAPDLQARVIDADSGTDVPSSTVGELLIRGPAMMQNYHGRSREDCFDTDGWFHTGDLVRRDDDGVYYFVGRSGSMIKTAGANVAPAEVEKAVTAVLSADPRTAGAGVHVLGLPDAERGQLVAAVVTTDSGEPVDDTAVRRALRSQLSTYKIPRRFVTVRHSELPLLSSGKVDVPALRRLFDD